MNRRAPIASCLVLALTACSSPPADSRTTPRALPDAATFPPVAEMLVVRCGSLDCHGTVARNLRLYGSAGLRWAPSDRPLVPACDTPDEDAQDYESVVGLEPEKTGDVAAGGDPGELTMVRKARGTEAHKGGRIWAQGDDSDACLTAWLGGAPDPAACTRAVAGVVPGGADNPLAKCMP